MYMRDNFMTLMINFNNISEHFLFLLLLWKIISQHFSNVECVRIKQKVFFINCLNLFFFFWGMIDILIFYKQLNLKYEIDCFIIQTWCRFFYICDIGYPYLYDRREKSEHFFHSITMRKMINIFWLQSLFFIVYQPESCDIRFVFFCCH